MCTDLFRMGCDALTALSTFALAVLALVALIYTAVQLYYSRRESKITHLIELEDWFRQNPLAGYRQQLALQRISNNSMTAISVTSPPH
jgi:hypothetical protein